MDNKFRGSLPQNSTRTHWRSDPQNYKPPGESQPCPGNINLSPAWFQLAHTVSRMFSYFRALIYFYRSIIPDSKLQAGDFKHLEAEIGEQVDTWMARWDFWIIHTDGCLAQYRSSRIVWDWAGGSAEGGRQSRDGQRWWGCPGGYATVDHTLLGIWFD